MGGLLVWVTTLSSVCVCVCVRVCACVCDCERKPLLPHLHLIPPSPSLLVQGLRGQEIMSMLESNERLECPEKCPAPVYDVMIRTWSWRYAPPPSPPISFIFHFSKSLTIHSSIFLISHSFRPEDRPSFADLVKIMSDLYTFLNPPARPPRAPPAVPRPVARPPPPMK